MSARPRHRAPEAAAPREPIAAGARTALQNRRTGVFWFLSVLCATLLVAAPVAIFLSSVPAVGWDDGSAEAGPGGSLDPEDPDGLNFDPPVIGATPPALGTQSFRSPTAGDYSAGDSDFRGGAGSGSTNAVSGSGSGGSGSGDSGDGSSGGSGGGGGGDGTGGGDSGGDSGGGDDCECPDPVETVTKRLEPVTKPVEDAVGDVTKKTKETADQLTEPIGGLPLGG